jgi:hypothetical protein
MQPEAGQIHVLRFAGTIQDGKNVFHFLDVICLEAFGLTIFKQPFQPFVPEASNHDFTLYTSISLYLEIDNCRLSPYAYQL